MSAGVTYDLESMQRARQTYYDHRAFCTQAIQIRWKDGVTRPLQWTPALDKLTAAIQRQEDRGLPVRICVLKAGQVNMSASVASHVFRRAAFRLGSKARVYANLYESIESIYSYYEGYLESFRDPAGILRPLKRTGGRKFRSIEFEGGGSITFHSADNAEGGGRGHSFQYLHLSENAFWRDPITMRTALLARVPYEQGTMVVDESTANGEGGPFYEAFWRAYDPGNKSDYVAVFFAAQEHPDYRLPIEDPHAFQQSMTDEEHRLREEHRLPLEFLNWRRRKLATDFAGNVNQFNQEFPLTPEMAFLSSGMRRFDASVLIRQPAVDPPAKGNLEIFEVGIERKLQFSPSDSGPLVVYQRPLRGHRYCIGVDTAHGIDAAAKGDTNLDPDYSVAFVVDEELGDQVAQLRLRMEPIPFARLVYYLHRWYNDAFVCPEAVGVGIAVVGELMKMVHPSLLYQRGRTPDDKSPVLLQQVGYDTKARGEGSKEVLITELERALYDGELFIRDKWTLSELRAYVRDSKGKLGASPGRHDDCVIAAALAQQARLAARRQRPPLRKPDALATVVARAVRPFARRPSTGPSVRDDLD